MAPHSSTLAWKIPWMEEPGRLQSMGSLRVGHDWSDLSYAFFSCNAPSMFPIFLKRSLVFPLLLFSSIIKHCSLKKAFLSLLAIFLNLASNWMCVSLSPLLFSSLHSFTICKASSDNHFAVLLFFLFWMVLFTISCTILWTSIHSSLDTLN